MLNGSDQVPLAQPVLAPLTRAAIFMVVTVKPDSQSYATLRAFCVDLSGIIELEDGVKPTSAHSALTV